MLVVGYSEDVNRIQVYRSDRLGYSIVKLYQHCTLFRICIMWIDVSSSDILYLFWRFTITVTNIQNHRAISLEPSGRTKRGFGMCIAFASFTRNISRLILRVLTYLLIVLNLQSLLCWIPILPLHSLGYPLDPQSIAYALYKSFRQCRYLINCLVAIWLEWIKLYQRHTTLRFYRT